MNEVDALVEEVLKEFLLDVPLVGKNFAVELPASVLCVLAMSEIEQHPGIPMRGFSTGVSQREAA